MKKLAYSTAGKTVDQTLGFIRLMIGEDMPHTKFSGYGCYSKDWLVLNAIQSKYIVIEDSGMLSVCGNESFLKEEGYIEVDYCGEPITDTKDNKWYGEGLPPIGVECKFTPDNTFWGFNYIDEVVGEVLHYEGEQFVFMLKHKQYNLEESMLVVSRTDKGKFSKLETPQEKENRERLEAAYDLYLTHENYIDNPVCSLSIFTESNEPKNKWLAIVDKTSHHKGE